MTSAFEYYGNSDVVLREIKYLKPDEKYQIMFEQMTPEWRNAVLYVLGRSTVKIYIDGMYKAFTSGILNKISPDSVFAGSTEFIQNIKIILNE